MRDAGCVVRVQGSGFRVQEEGSWEVGRLGGWEVGRLRRSQRREVRGARRASLGCKAAEARSLGREPQVRAYHNHCALKGRGNIQYPSTEVRGLGSGSVSLSVSVSVPVSVSVSVSTSAHWRNPSGLFAGWLWLTQRGLLQAGGNAHDRSPILLGDVLRVRQVVAQ
jgi:hypothetical protein